MLQAIGNIEERSIMETIAKPMLKLFPRMEQLAEDKARFPEGPVNNQEATLATVMMTQHVDTRMQLKFHRLQLMSEDNTIVSTHSLNRKLTHVGRSRRNHMQIKDPQVSVKHLSVSTRGNTCVVNDLNSSNGTFINGERLVGGQVLNDGDEIMLGKTIMRFAAREAEDPVLKNRIRPAFRQAFFKGKILISASLSLCLVMAVVLFLLSTRVAPGLNDIPSSPPDHLEISSSSTDSQTETQPSVSMAPQEGDDGLYSKPAPTATSFIQEALNDYASGRLDMAIKPLERLSMVREHTPEAAQAKQIMVLFDIVREMHAEALQAEQQKAYAKAIDCWDRLLVVDLELTGDRPSYFANQAEKRVQQLSYEYALESYGLKNNEKARQLCNVILQINPAHQGALTLLAEIGRKA
jgi:hypothetical protein